MMPSTTVTEASAPSMTAVAPPCIPASRRRRHRPAARTRLLLEARSSNAAAPRRPERGGHVVLIAVTAGVRRPLCRPLGPSALAGLSLVFPLLMLMQQMATRAWERRSASSIAARSVGRRQDASALGVSAPIAGGMAAIFTGLLLSRPHVLRTDGGHGPTLAAAVEYRTRIFAGALVAAGC